VEILVAPEVPLETGEEHKGRSAYRGLYEPVRHSAKVLHKTEILLAPEVVMGEGFCALKVG
jgi:hypothetical protein